MHSHASVWLSGRGRRRWGAISWKICHTGWTNPRNLSHTTEWTMFRCQHFHGFFFRNHQRKQHLINIIGQVSSYSHVWWSAVNKGSMRSYKGRAATLLVMPSTQQRGVETISLLIVLKTSFRIRKWFFLGGEAEGEGSRCIEVRPCVHTTTIIDPVVKGGGHAAAPEKGAR